MQDGVAELTRLHRKVQELLLAYLEAVPAAGWPGADGLTEEAILQSYPELSVAGCVPKQAELMRRHPERADALQAYFDGKKNRL
jgi:hypothetical protein